MGNLLLDSPSPQHHVLIVDDEEKLGRFVSIVLKQIGYMPVNCQSVAEARKQLGKPYVWGGSGPDNFDCSGLTAWAWKAGGRTLPHSSQAQYGATRRVSVADVAPGVAEAVVRLYRAYLDQRRLDDLGAVARCVEHCRTRPATLGAAQGRERKA